MPMELRDAPNYEYKPYGPEGSGTFLRRLAGTTDDWEEVVPDNVPAEIHSMFEGIRRRKLEHKAKPGLSGGLRASRE